MAFSPKCALLLLALGALCHVTFGSEYCKYQRYKRCTGYTPYCCNFSTSIYSEYCCSDCEKSIYSTTRSSCYIVEPSVVVGAVIGALILIGFVIGLIVLCCLGCICTGLTGRTRRGRVANPNAAVGVGGGYTNPGVTVYTTPAAYPQQGYGQNVYPSSAGNDANQGAYPPSTAVGNQGAYPPSTGGYQTAPYPPAYSEAPPPYANPKV